MPTIFSPQLIRSGVTRDAVSAGGARSVLDQSYVWEVLPTRFDAAIDARTLVIWERVGLFDEYSPFGIHFTGEDEGEEIKKEVNAILLRAIEALRLQRIAYLRAGRGVGSPPPHI
jgi:hypothetical protein